MVTGTGWANLCDVCFLIGEWEEASELARQQLRRGELTGGLYSEPSFVFVLAEIDAARAGETDETIATARRIVELAHARLDDQMVVTLLPVAAWMLARAGEDSAGPLLDQFVERRRRNIGGLIPGAWSVYAALAFDRLGRKGELARLGERPGLRFLEAAVAIDSARFDEAAETLAAIGAAQLEAETWLLGADERRGAGDEPGADERVARARALFQRLGATARLRELEAEVSSRSGGS
jgi:hypothetical protein